MTYSILTPINDGAYESNKTGSADDTRKNSSISSTELLGTEAGAASVPKSNLPETRALMLLTKSPEHKHLLKHPLLTSFLWLKWERIYRMYNQNLRFHMLFVYILTWYVFEKFGGNIARDNHCNDTYGPTINGQNITVNIADEKFAEYNIFYVAYFILIIIQMLFIIKDLCSCILRRKAFGVIYRSLEILFLTGCTTIILAYGSIKWDLQVILIIFTVLLIIREVFQAMLSLTQYICYKNNWVDVLLFGLIYYIMFYDDNCDTSFMKLKRILCSFIIVISWVDLFVAIGTHPSFIR